MILPMERRGGSGLMVMLALLASFVPAPRLGAAETDHPRPAATALVHVAPVDDSGGIRADFVVAKTFEGGECRPFSASIGAGYRCGADHFLFDPCWAETSGAEAPSALCMPWP
jgi:hypothetical protein